MTEKAHPMLGTSVLALAAMHCRNGAPRLSADELAAHVASLAAWTMAGERIVREFRFSNYHETIAFVNAIAWIAHTEDHHPDLTVGYSRCAIAYATHDAGGVTLNDIICAAKVERLFA